MTFSKAELIPIEKKRVLQKYKELFPNFNKKYKREIDFNEAAIAYDLSMQFLNEEKKKEAIEILAPFIDIRFKYKLFYFYYFYH